jgi:hypothetical protein
MFKYNNPVLYNYGSNYLPSSYSCLYKSYIDKNSIIALLLTEYQILNDTAKYNSVND